MRLVSIGGATRSQLLSALASAGVQLNAAAMTLLGDERFSTSIAVRTLPVVEVSTAALGLPHGGTFEQVVQHAARKGFSLCPLELAPHLRLQYLEQPEGSAGFPPSQGCAPPGSITVAAAPLADDDQTPKGFYLRRIDGVLWLRGYRSHADHVWRPGDVFAFACADATSTT